MVPDGDSVRNKGRRTVRLILWCPRGWDYTGWFTELSQLITIKVKPKLRAEKRLSLLLSLLFIELLVLSSKVSHAASTIKAVITWDWVQDTKHSRPQKTCARVLIAFSSAIALSSVNTARGGLVCCLSLPCH